MRKVVRKVVIAKYPVSGCFLSCDVAPIWCFLSRAATVVRSEAGAKSRSRRHQTKKARSRPMPVVRASFISIYIFPDGNAARQLANLVHATGRILPVDALR